MAYVRRATYIAIDSDIDGSWAGNRTFILTTHDKRYEDYNERNLESI